MPIPASADDDVSTGRRALGTALGSVDGALVARAFTLNEQRTPRTLIAYGVAVGAGAGIGYATADSDDALSQSLVRGDGSVEQLIYGLALLPAGRLPQEGGSCRSSSAGCPVRASGCRCPRPTTPIRATAGFAQLSGLLGRVVQIGSMIPN